MKPDRTKDKHTDVIDKETGLNQRQENFCQAYTNLAGDSFGNASKSYTAAGYLSQNPAQPASKLLRSHHIKERIAVLHAEYLQDTGISPESVIANIRYDRSKAREAGQYSVAAQLDRLEGQILSLFGDKITMSGDKAPELTPKESQEVEEIADIVKRRWARNLLTESDN